MRYLLGLLTTTAVLLGTYGLVEVGVDEFGVFGTPVPRREVCMPNTRIVKLRYLESHPEYDAFVLGSSRANSYRVETLDRLSGRRYYNLTSPMENALGMEGWVRWLVAHRSVREVLLTLDYDLQEHPYVDSDLFVKDPPEFTGTPRAAFTARYLLAPPDQLAACIRAKLNPSPAYYFDVRTGEEYQPGRPTMVLAPRRIEMFAGGRRDPNVDRLAAMVGLLRAHGVVVRVVADPVWAPRLLTWNASTYALWIRNVAEVTGGFWDFSGVSRVTLENANYYDDVHFTREIGNRAIQSIFGGGGDSFGFWVTPANVEARLRTIRRDYADGPTRVRVPMPRDG
jgi:hypothetical protein